MRVTSLYRSSILAAVLLFAGCGFQIEKLAKEDVANGVARLSVQNAGAILALLNADAECGFANPDVLANFETEGNVGEEGRVTWTVTNCSPPMAEPIEATRDCQDNATVISADRLVLNATRTVEGTLTGNPENPVVPNRPDAVEFLVTAEMDRMKVKALNKKEFMRIVAGTMSFSAKPAVAMSNVTNVCSAPTRIVTFSDISYAGKTSAYVDSGDRRFDVEIDSAHVNAQAGRWGEHENELTGELTVWGKKVKFPNDDKDGLDPDYDREAYAQSYECGEELRVPVQFSCPTLSDVSASGAASLTVAAFGRLADFYDDDRTCGPNSAAVTSRVVLSGEIGKPGGTATYTVSTPCAKYFGKETAPATDCNGVKTLFSGRVSMTGTVKVKGILTGDPRAPIVPTSRDPAEVNMTFKFDRFSVTDSTRKNKMTLHSGEISGKLQPRMGIDTTLGACAIKTPIAQFTNLQHRNSKVTVESEGMVFDMTLGTSALNAQNGPKDEVTNWIGGSLMVDGEVLTLPRPNMPPTLDPTYDAEAFQASYTCKPHFQIAKSESDCSFKKTLGENAARLLIQTAGMAATQVNDSKSCGFSALWVMTDPDVVTGKVGEEGSIAWSVDGCKRDEDPGTILSTDCSGERTFVQGKADISAKRTITGIREDKFYVFDSIRPDWHDSARIDLKGIVFDEYAAYTVPGGAALPVGKLTIHSGWMSGTVMPRLGERRDTRGLFDVPTPVATFQDVEVSDITATLESDGKRFELYIPEGKINAQNGAFGGKTNYLNGSITVDREVVKFDGLKLNPEYDAARFNRSYVCTDNLLGIVAPN